MTHQLQTVRNPPPRMLTTNETLHSLNHWRTSFRTYYRRDGYFKAFLLPDATWTNSARNHYGQTEDTNGTVVTRTAADKGEDLQDFLNTLAGYLPFPYLTEKIVKGSANLNNVWDIIYDHYGINVTSESLLDYASLKLNDGETYRQFFDRLLSHARLHLPKADITVDGINTGTAGESMTVSLMNFIAVDWLQKINPHLISIVKIEYSKDLRENVQLAELVPRIASNIDAMLSRSDIVGGVEKLTVAEENAIDTINRVKHSKSNYKKKNDKQFFKPVKRNRPFCPDCDYLAKKLKLDINYHHTPADCPRPKAAVNVLITNDLDSADTEDDDIPDITGKTIIDLNDPNKSYQRSPDSVTMDPVDEVENSFVQQMNVLDTNDILINHAALYYKVLSLQKQITNTVRKENSPQLRIKLDNVITDAIIDEGSELNCLCSSLVMRCGLKFNPVSLKAVAAGSNVMQLLGVIPYDIKLRVCDAKDPTDIILKSAVVVKNLGPNILIGEPGKMDNDVMTIPKRKLIQLRTNNNRSIQLPYRAHAGRPLLDYVACSSKDKEILYPNDDLIVPIPSSMQCRAVGVTMRREFQICHPSVENTKKEYVRIKNNSNDIILIPKHSHILDLRSCEEVDFTNGQPSSIMKIYDISREDLTHLAPPDQLSADTSSYTHDILIDPDKQMSMSWRKRFTNLCESYSEIITPRPGRYNGAFGRVSTDINFVSKPPANLKTYLPKYSSDMLRTLADKMDTLESWGVLRKPEDLGIIPEYVVPSMLTPKPEKNQFRLVTDFTSLNKFIRKLPTVSPSIQEAKEKIARYKYHAFLDLSNYYYQGGMKIEDSQYLATVHPFKGLMVYTVEPQGLLNSGEHAYERLGRIYGDMCATERMTRMADGLYVLANTYADLFENLKEVFERAKKSNLTFKPSKMIICPLNTIVFGWQKQGDAWTPTAHTTLPLINATPPTTVKQLRSWIGSYKQLSACIRDYAVPLTQLEKMTGSDKNSSTKIQWTEQLLKDFEEAKAKIKALEKVYTPTPEDTLHTYSDFSAQHNAVGGKLIIVRKINGSEVKLNGGFFSARLNKFQSRWLPCEGEALSCKLVLEHFKHYIRESKNKVIHFTDSLPCVQAFKRAKMGAFSASARIATFLTTLSSLNVEILHKAGKDIELVDYISRHPNVCIQERCQICRFVNEQVNIGDNTAKLNSIHIGDVMSGKLPTPFLQRKSWIEAQQKDQTHITLVDLIKNAQSPERRKTGNENTKLKLLHNLYREGKLTIHKDGLISITHTDQNGNKHQAISIPTILFPGLMYAIHYKLNHPSKLQLTKLVARHFYTPGYQRIIEEVISSCETCAALKQLPKDIFSESTGNIDGFGSHFSADIIERNQQIILIVREKLSSFTLTKLINNQTAETLKLALIPMILDMLPQSGTTVQVDCAPAWQTLANESKRENSELKRLNINVDLGRHHNKNKNPVVDNACKEFHKELLRIKPNGSSLTAVELATITANMNQRIRKSGYSSKEICFRRDLIKNTGKDMDDTAIANDIIEDRKKKHKTSNSNQEDIHTGHNVFIKQDRSKLIHL